MESSVEGSNPSPVATLGYDFGTPAEALEYLTLESWSQPEFLELTQDEARDLLDLDDTVGFKGPESMVSIAGPLPTHDDCERGMQTSSAQRMLREALAYEAALEELGSVPLEMQPDGTKQRRTNLVKLRDDAAEALMRELDKTSGCTNWLLYWRLWRRWAAG